MAFGASILACAAGCSGYAPGIIGLSDAGADAREDVTELPDAIDEIVPPKDASGTDAKPSTPPLAQLSEIAPNVSGGADLIELTALASGSLAGWTIEQDVTNPTVLATLPAINVVPGEVIVVHLAPPGGVVNETSSKSSCSSGACYAGAWDVAGGATGITFSGRVIVLRRADKTIADGVPFYRNGLASGSGFATEVMALQKAGAWLPATCGGNPCATNDLAEPISVDWLGVGTSAGGATVARKKQPDGDVASDWAIGASTLGTTN
jgi:hypothetical protein